MELDDIIKRLTKDIKVEKFKTCVRVTYGGRVEVVVRDGKITSVGYCLGEKH